MPCKPIWATRSASRYTGECSEYWANMKMRENDDPATNMGAGEKWRIWCRCAFKSVKAGLNCMARTGSGESQSVWPGYNIYCADNSLYCTLKSHCLILCTTDTKSPLANVPHQRSRTQCKKTTACPLERKLATVYIIEESQILSRELKALISSLASGNVDSNNSIRDLLVLFSDPQPLSD